MKLLVIGGTSGLGRLIAKKCLGVGIGRSNGFEWPANQEKIKKESIDSCVIINCIPDEQQLDCLKQLIELHETLNLTTYFITVGSMSWRIKPDHYKKKLFDFNEEQLFKKTTVKHTLLNPAELFNSRNNDYFEKISEDEILEVVDFLIYRYNKNSIIHHIEVRGKKL
jgi:hypothetical protein